MQKCLLNWLCGELAVDKAELLSKRRDDRLVESRKVIVCFLRDLGWSYPAIAKHLKRDHTSIINLHKKSDDFTREWAEMLRTKWEIRNAA